MNPLRAPLDLNQRRAVVKQTISNPHVYEAIVGGLREKREAAIQQLLRHTEPALMNRAQGQVQVLDELIEEYNECLTGQ